jgi:hypothetical protein
MKATIFTAALSAALFPVCLQAQRHHHLGLVAGFGHSSLRSNCLEMVGGRQHATVGVAYLVPIGRRERLEYTQEVTYTRGGGSARVQFLREEQSPGETQYRYHFSAYETAALLGYRPVKGLHLQVGGYLAAMTNRLDRSQPNLLLADQPDFFMCTPAFKFNQAFAGLDYGPIAGLSVGNDRVRFNARYHLGVRNLHRQLDHMPQGERFIRTGSARVGLAFFLK